MEEYVDSQTSSYENFSKNEANSIKMRKFYLVEKSGLLQDHFVQHVFEGGARISWKIVKGCHPVLHYFSNLKARNSYFVSDMGLDDELTSASSNVTIKDQVHKSINDLSNTTRSVCKVNGVLIGHVVVETNLSLIQLNMLKFNVSLVN